MVLIIILIIAAVFTIGYAVLIETYRRWFLQVPLFRAHQQHVPRTSFSVIIPARNEEEQIEACLLSVLQQNYPSPLFEVILVDDHSTDNTAAIATSLQHQYPNLKVLKLAELLDQKSLNSYKKKAIDTAIQYSSKEWIVTTDADCIVHTNWLKTLDAFIQQQQPVFVAAPVAFTNTGSFVSRFQFLDFMSLQGITAAAVHKKFHSMCNGANLAYSKKAFYEVGGFKGIDTIASGDDMLLMHKIYKKHPSQVGFLLSKEAIVETAPMHTWSAFFNQRIRWASKADKFDDKRIFSVLLFIYLYNFFFLALLVMSLWWQVMLLVWLALIALKTLVELRLVIPVARFFNAMPLLWWFPVMQPFHIGYTIIAGWLGKFGKYTWKGRSVK
ncbi:glycosyltransferase family 2 protein [Aridibaculum aurantiacum]|uniref:glycosyltransferase family 2 protein n=1 Tax=Aridibaculum aurantiacum TaxID=2810307 RepID=UPI001A968BCE|nr:glycosyltransferase [Aridibaculum aurantiacum]